MQNTRRITFLKYTECMSTNKKKTPNLFQSVASRLSRLFGREGIQDPEQDTLEAVQPDQQTTSAADTSSQPSAEPSSAEQVAAPIQTPEVQPEAPSTAAVQTDKPAPPVEDPVLSQYRPAREKKYRPRLGTMEPEMIREAIHDYVLSQLDNTQLTVELMAAALKTSRTGLYQLVHEHYGMTPLNYILHVRLQKAVEKLEREMSVRDVSMQCGFSDPKYFSKVFRKYKGVLPSAYLASVKSAKPEAEQPEESSAES